MARRGDNIPPVSDYAHWNEDAYAMWYEENKYDMLHADEEIEEDNDDPYDDYELDNNVDEEFASKEEAEEYYNKMIPQCESLSWGKNHWNDKYHVTGITNEYWKEQYDRIHRRREIARQAKYHEDKARRLRGNLYDY